MSTSNNAQTHKKINANEISTYINTIYSSGTVATRKITGLQQQELCLEAQIQTYSMFTSCCFFPAIMTIQNKTKQKQPKNDTITRQGTLKQ